MGSGFSSIFNTLFSKKVIITAKHIADGTPTNTKRPDLSEVSRMFYLYIKNEDKTAPLNISDLYVSATINGKVFYQTDFLKEEGSRKKTISISEGSEFQIITLIKATDLEKLNEYKVCANYKVGDEHFSENITKYLANDK